MNSRIFNNRRNDDDTNSDEEGSEESGLNPELVANLDDLMDNDDPRLRNYLLAHGYRRDNADEEMDEEMDVEYDEDSEWNPSEDAGSQAGGDEEDDNIFYIEDPRNEILHEEMLLEEGKIWIGPRNEPVININKPCDCSRFSEGSPCMLLNLNNNWIGIDFEDERLAAVEFYETNTGRDPNNLQRKRMYRLIFEALYNFIEIPVNEATGRLDRVELPRCSYALVRMIWPSETGVYMGFRTH